MSDVVLRVENLWKQYRLGVIGVNTIRDDLRRLWAKLRGKEDPLLKIGETNDRENIQGEYVWALQDINFEVKRGEVVGIIGKNGAGKSTLLKILSKLTTPTRGKVYTKGRVSSLLEVGTGFHPELTGRENIFLNGAILGMTKSEIRKKFDEIVNFSGIGKYIDTPVKRYSSGMYVRLAFAVAAHLEPDILIVDEVLAVGDAEFQKKCLGKMKEVSGEGRTVLFVSHNMQAIRFLCTKALLLQKGKILLNSNDVEKCTKFYLLDSYGNNNENNSEFVKAIKGNVPQIVKVKVNTSEDKLIQRNGKKMSVDFWLYTPQGLPSASLSFIIKDEYGNNIVHLWLLNSEKPICTKKGITHVRCVIENLRLYMGRYSIDVFFGCALSKLLYDVVEGVCLFEVIMDRYREYEWQPNTCKYIEDCYWELCKEEYA